MAKQTENQAAIAGLQSLSLDMSLSGIERVITTLQTLRDLLPKARRDVWAAASVRIASVSVDLDSLVKHIEAFGLDPAHQSAAVAPIAT